jgi:oleandomycin transport system ATP-binding protein
VSYAIETEGLAKRFGNTTALDGVDFAARHGAVLGLLGPNGAGKTTAVRILATLVKPDAGRAAVHGHDVVAEAAEVRRLIALTGQYAAVDEDLTGSENLVLIARLLRLPRARARRVAAELLERFDLAAAAGRSVRTYSGGMRRRLDLAASLIGEPRVLYLDEPTTGLDPRSRGEVWELLRGLVAGGVTVLLTTQYLDEADRLADDIVVIDHGRVIASGTPDELKARIGGRTLQIRPLAREQLGGAAAIVGQLAGEAPVVDADHGLVTAKVDDSALLPAAVRRLDEAGIATAELALRLPSLDEVFLALTGGGAAPAAGPAGPGAAGTAPDAPAEDDPRDDHSDPTRSLA